MGIRDYKPRRTVVPLGDTSLSVRGLSLTDISELVGNHLKNIDELMEMFEAKGNDVFAEEAGNNLIQLLTSDAPELTGKIIALASDEASDRHELDQLAKACESFPFPVQIDALMAIGKHTFEDAGGPKEFFRKLKALRGIGNMLAPTKKT